MAHMEVLQKVAIGILDVYFSYPPKEMAYFWLWQASKLVVPAIPI
jgi:hypothetical protein